MHVFANYCLHAIVIMLQEITNSYKHYNKTHCNINR